MRLTQQTLDEFILETDRRGGPGAPDCVAYWKDLVYEPSVALDAQLNPGSAEYKEQQLALYREITGHSYFDARDEQTPNVPIDRLLQAPNAYDHANPVDFAKHCIAMSLLVQELALPKGARILELGSGWGATQEFLAMCGYDTVGIEINDDFVRSSNGRLRRLGFGDRVINESFEGIDHTKLGIFDAVVSYEALHHSPDPEGMVKKYCSCLKREGAFALAAEPFNNFYASWGIRLDPYSIYAIRKFGWFESGWSIEYMAYLMGRCGLRAKFIEPGLNELTRYMIGRLSDDRHPYQLGMWHPAISSGWWHSWEYFSSRGNSEMMLPRQVGATGIEVGVVNFNTKPLNVLLVVANREHKFTISPGASCLAVGIESCPGADDLRLRLVSETFCPAEMGINTDARQLGIHVDRVSWRR